MPTEAATNGGCQLVLAVQAGVLVVSVPNRRTQETGCKPQQSDQATHKYTNLSWAFAAQSRNYILTGVTTLLGHGLDCTDGLPAGA